ncbi:hypothetical protein [Clostridium sp. BJN0001]|uniref:hypothetical protein n=1 Tax=Clostridium sp. BJN0001 TaxID=2930219 RepID=UPI001FD4AC84|nr:hypothetical protein [Clostridium sp. BJN0001]
MKSYKYVDIKFTLSILLVISIVANIYYFVINRSYRYESEKYAYTAITDIRDKNEINYNIINKGIQAGFISNTNLLRLYKNYESIDSDLVLLGKQYSEHVKESIPFFYKKIDKVKVFDKLEYDNITEYILSNLNETMETEEKGLTLGSNETYYADVLSKMATELKTYFEDFDNKYLQNIPAEKREKIIINKHYWIDMINGMSNINEKYGNVEWKLKEEINKEESSEK